MTALFGASARAGPPWFFAGLTSSFLDVSSQEGKLSEIHLCGQNLAQGCKAFYVPRSDTSQAVEVELQDPVANVDLSDQVLVFQHRGKFHAIDHKCPHSSFPLSKGRLFDIEDFGVVLSAGIACPKHDWSFDLYSGQADRGTYKLGIWEVQLRPLAEPQKTDFRVETPEVKELWVRRKQRIG